MTLWLCVQVVMSGKQGSPDSEALIEAAHSVPAPDKVRHPISAHLMFWGIIAAAEVRCTFDHP